MTTRLTVKLMTLAIGGLCVSTLGASLAGVARIDLDNCHSKPFSLVAQEECKLGISPPMDLSALWLAKPSLADAVQLFDCDDRAAGFVRKLNYGLGSFVIDIAHEPRLSARQPFEHLGDGSRWTLCLSLLEGRSNMQVSITNMLRVPTFTHPMTLAICCASKNIDSSVNADNGIVRGGASFNLLFEAKDEKDSLADNHEATVTEFPVGDLVIKSGRAGERNRLDPSVYSPDRQAEFADGHISSALPALENDGLWLKDSRGLQLVFVGPDCRIFTTNVSDAGLSNLRRQATISSWTVCQRVKPDRIADAPVVKGNTADDIAGCCPSPHSTPSRVDRHVYFELYSSNYFQHNSTLQYVLEEVNEKLRKGVHSAAT